MTVQTLSRKEKRARIAKASKLYGIKGEESLALHDAYHALGAGDVRGALTLAHPVTKSHPANPHGWIILGGAALHQREGQTAKAFFGKALDGAPRDAMALAGMAKAHVLAAEVEPAVQAAARAIAAGSDDVGLMTLYMQLMARLGRRLVAAEVIEPVAGRIASAPLALALADMLVEAEQTGRAVDWLFRCWRLDPAPELHRLARLRGLLYAVRLDEAEALAREMLPEATNRDAVVLALLTGLRVQQRLDEAQALAEEFEFTDPASYAQARGMVANIMQDRGDDAAADACYAEALHIGGDPTRIAKAYGAFLFRGGRYEKGWPHYQRRFGEVQRRMIPAENALPEALAARDHIYLVGEQGVGDQLALLTLLRMAPLPEGCRITMVGDPRFGALLQGNGLNLAHMAQSVFQGGQLSIPQEELVYMGDLARYLGTQPPAVRHGAFLSPPASRLEALRQKYRAMSGGAPVVGVAWSSRSLIGLLRSLPLARIAETLPEGALVVNLQYGDCRAEIAAAQALRPDLTFLTDPEVDQMADLASFAAQIAAVDRVVTIDNTTAHMCGAVGHADAHLLVPSGSECMWYWGGEGSADPWYGVLRIHRQLAGATDWTAPLEEIRALWRG